MPSSITGIGGSVNGSKAPLSVYGTFKDAVRDAGTRPFLCVPVTGGSPHLFSYREIDDAVERLRGWYAAAGFGEGHKVSVLLERVPFVCHFLALNALGCVAVPLNPDLHEDELLYQVDHSGVSVIVTNSVFGSRMQSLAARSAGGCAVVVSDGLEADATLPRPGAAEVGLHFVEDKHDVMLAAETLEQLNVFLLRME